MTANEILGWTTCSWCGHPYREHGAAGFGDDVEPVCIEEPKDGYPIRLSGTTSSDEEPF